MIKIAIVGAGQLGSRHLQALALMDGDAHIQVVDPNPNSLEVARQRFEEVKRESRPIRVDYFSEIDELMDSLDVVIVATNSDSRRAVIEKLLAYKTVRYLILEKVLFQREEDYGCIRELLKSKGVKTWVNCPRRIWPIYKQLKLKFKDAKCVDFSVTGSNIGIGCNGIHFLDILAYLTDEVDFKLFSDQLDNEVIQTKRPGFIDFTGTLYGVSPHHTRFSITHYLNGSVPAVVQINSDRIRCLIDETNGIAKISEKINDWKWEQVSFEVPYQSHLTHLVVQQILDNGSCALTDFDDSCRLHLSLLKPLLEKYSLEGGTLCPIT